MADDDWAAQQRAKGDPWYCKHTASSEALEKWRDRALELAKPFVEANPRYTYRVAVHRGACMVDMEIGRAGTDLGVSGYGYGLSPEDAAKDLDGAINERWRGLTLYMDIQNEECTVKDENIQEPKPSIKIGDIVRLRSGGPKMTVVASLEDGEVRCAFFTGLRGDCGSLATPIVPQSEIYPMVALDAVPPEENAQYSFATTDPATD